VGEGEELATYVTRPDADVDELLHYTLDRFLYRLGVPPHSIRSHCSRIPNAMNHCRSESE
jgi:hypothetical protein